MKKDIFRKISLERRSSPEQLDQLVQITTPKGWVALSALGGLLILTIIWSFVGSIPTKVSGQGILLKTGGVFDVVSMGTGRISDIAVRIGDEVEAGQVIARIDQPELASQLNQARANLDEIRTQQGKLNVFDNQNAQIRLAYLAKERANIEASIQTAEERLEWLDKKVTAQEELVEDGLITKQTLFNTRQQYYTTKEQIEANRNQLRALELETLTLENNTEQATLSRQFQINETERLIEKLTQDLEMRSRIVSPHTGRVLEITVAKGDLVNMGQGVVQLDLVGREVKDLEAFLYVSALDGKKIKPGMQIQIAPTTVKSEEYGFMLGTVTYVSDYPATPAGMNRVLKNQNLIQALAGGGAPYEVHADLTLDLSTESKFKWTSSSGPPTQIQSGTLCGTTITVMERRPIALVIPLFRKFTGL